MDSDSRRLIAGVGTERNRKMTGGEEGELVRRIIVVIVRRPCGEGVYTTQPYGEERRTS